MSSPPVCAAPEDAVALPQDTVAQEDAVPPPARVAQENARIAPEDAGTSPARTAPEGVMEHGIDKDGK